MNYIKTPVPGILKNLDTHVVINTNDSEYERILEKRRQFKQTRVVQEEIDNLKNEFLELKEMIRQVLIGRT